MSALEQVGDSLGALALLAYIGAALGAVLERLLPWRCRLACTAALPLLSLLPLPSGLSALAYLLGLLAPLSAGSLVGFSAMALAVCRRRAAPRGLPVGLATALLVLGLVLYPATAGLARFDPYELGYSGAALPVLLGAILLAGLLSGRTRALSLWLCLACAGFLAGAMNSRNLWDYLVDPLAFAAALLTLAGIVVARLRRPHAARSENAATTAR